ncbi:MAG TPA: hypothetical protein VMF59_03655 [Bacteroidota bacterium]|nr:hypothetical protein [Bacteroidota bacterium]
MTSASPGAPPGALRLYRALALALCAAFAAVGLLFLFFPGAPWRFFNGLSEILGMPRAPEEGRGLFHLLGVAYMYLVTLLAFLMYARPLKGAYPWLLVHAKGASALLSVYLFIADGPFLIYCANALVDGSIAVGVGLIALSMKRVPA